MTIDELYDTVSIIEPSSVMESYLERFKEIYWHLSDEDKQKKQDYANDFDHLVATTAKENRTKGDKGPSEWMPESSKCEYAKVYTHIVKKYNLNLNKADKDTLEKALNSCSN